MILFKHQIWITNDVNSQFHDKTTQIDTTTSQISMKLLDYGVIVGSFQYPIKRSPEKCICALRGHLNFYWYSKSAHNPLVFKNCHIHKFYWTLNLKYVLERRKCDKYGEGNEKVWNPFFTLPPNISLKKRPKKISTRYLKSLISYWFSETTFITSTFLKSKFW